MNPTVEQIKQEGVTREQSVFSKVESETNTNTQRVEREPKQDVTGDNNRVAVSQNFAPEQYSPIQRESVTDQGGLHSTNDFGNELDQKSRGEYSVDIRTVSNN